MKSHDLAKQLTLLAKVLRAGPNIQTADLKIGQLLNMHDSENTLSENEIPRALNALVGLNAVKKQQWVDLIFEYGFEIEIRNRDANRDIVGKLLNYLKDHPLERRKLVSEKEKKEISESSELADALNILLK